MSRRSTLSTKAKPGRPYARGAQAARAGVSRRKNPYRRGDPRWHAWDAGWVEGRRWS